MKWFPDEIDGTVVKDEDELAYQKALTKKFGPDHDLNVLRGPRFTDHVDLPENVYPILEWISGPGHLLLNPLFHQMYRYVKHKSGFTPFRLLVWSAILSCVVNVGLLMYHGVSNGTEKVYQVTLGFLFLVLLISFLRMLIVTLLHAPRLLANELEKGVIHSVFPTPLSDDEIFYGASMAHLLKSVPVIEQMASVLFGWVSVYLMINGTLAMNSLVYRLTDPFMMILTVMLLTMIGVFSVPYISLLMSRIAGLYSLAGSWLGVFFTAVAHLLIVGLASWLLGAITFYVIDSIANQSSHMLIIIQVVVSFIVIAAFIWVMIVYTGQLAVWALGQYRRKSGTIW